MTKYNLIWDFDGNLYDTYPVMMDAYKEAMASFDITISEVELQEAYKFCKLYSFKKLFEENEKKYGINAIQANKKYHELELEVQQRPQYFVGADEVLKKLFNEGHQNFLLTHRDTTAIGFLKEDDLAQYFTDYVTSENDFKRKPDPESINYLIDKYDLNPSHTFMIGDRDLDLEAGLNAGVNTIYYNVDGLNDNQHASYTVDQLLDILEVVKKQD